MDGRDFLGLESLKPIWHARDPSPGPCRRFVKLPRLL